MEVIVHFHLGNTFFSVAFKLFPTMKLEVQVLQNHHEESNNFPIALTKMTREMIQEN